MATRELEVKVREEGGTAVLDLRGDVDGAAEQPLQDAYARATEAGAGSIVFDFAGTEYINSTGIALIVGLLAQARSHGLPVRARGLSDHYREIFEITRLADFMTIEEGSDDA
jgi:anti-anti-sigma factor